MKIEVQQVYLVMFECVEYSMHQKFFYNTFNKELESFIDHQFECEFCGHANTAEDEELYF